MPSPQIVRPARALAAVGSQRGASGPAGRLAPAGAIFGWQDDVAFAALQRAYRPSGGIAPADDLGRLPAAGGSFVSVAELLDEQQIFAFECGDVLWVPMFQFDLRDCSLRPAPRQVRAELGDTFDGWTVAAWFVEPSRWLADRRPVDLLDTRLEAVLQAARADRLVAEG